MDSLTFHIISPWLIPYALEFLRFLVVGRRIYLGFNSLIIAICRYCFVVYDEQISQYGIAEARKVLICLSVAVPFMISIVICMFMEPSAMWSFLETNQFNKPCYLDKGNVTTNTSDYKRYPFPIYNLVRLHVPSYVLHGMTIFSYGSACIVLSNVVEGVLYCLLYTSTSPRD